ncbi:DUF2325 domain-containing protein [Desulfitibacter alkalitolerans]|uniref:DUF2325 domain-containing protein n=1 Tax=Desulfitibacter alkalitolerans TaxID=264641 RepID=UPI0004821939|nr:DUF2325 domain-containing protein [Desulfitibacter alkalitolerans]
MSILIVGGDGLEKIKKNLKKVGATDIQHISGRKRGDLTRDLPSNLDMILILTDYINHQLCSQIKQQAQERGIKTIFSKRSWSHIQHAMEM